MTESSRFLRQTYRDYCLYVLDTRALPLVTDGLKNVQRIALHLLRHHRDKVKTIGLAGEMSASELYVHGEVSAADAISRMAAPYLNNVQLITPIGQFGSRANPYAIAAPRYTNVKKSSFAEQVLYVDHEIVPEMGNYDGSKMMPATFLPLIPTVLLNGVWGRAPGYSTNILPRSPEDLCKAVTRVLAGETPGKLMPKWTRYDVTVKALGDNRYAVTGKFERQGTNRIIVTELPPSISLEAFKTKLIELEDEKRIIDFTDHSTDSINVEIKVSRNLFAEIDDDEIVGMLGLRTTVTERIQVIRWDGAKPMEYESAQKLVEDFVSWRLGWYKTRYERMLGIQNAEIRYWKAVLACFAAGLAKKVDKIESKASLKTDIANIISKAKIEPDEDDIDRIASIPLYRWTAEGEAEAKQKLKEAEKLVAEYTGILKSPAKQKAIFTQEVEALKWKK